MESLVHQNMLNKKKAQNCEKNTNVLLQKLRHKITPV